MNAVGGVGGEAIVGYERITLTRVLGASHA